MVPNSKLQIDYSYFESNNQDCMQSDLLLLNAYKIFSVMTTSTPEKHEGVKALNDAINKIEETINSLGGVFKVQMPVS